MEPVRAAMSGLLIAIAISAAGNLPEAGALPPGHEQDGEGDWEIWVEMDPPVVLKAAPFGSSGVVVLEDVLLDVYVDGTGVTGIPGRAPAGSGPSCITGTPDNPGYVDVCMRPQGVRSHYAQLQADCVGSAICAAKICLTFDYGGPEPLMTLVPAFLHASNTIPRGACNL